MKLFSVAVAFLAASGVSSNPVRRDADSILGAMGKISSKLTTLHDTVSGFNGGLTGTLTALQIHFQALDLASTVEDAAGTAKASAAIDDTGSAKVANGVTELQPLIFDTLDLIVSKKPAFDKAILGLGSAGFIVKDDLSKLRDNVKEFGDDVTAKLSSEFQKLAPLLLGNIDAHFRDAIIVYS